MNFFEQDRNSPNNDPRQTLVGILQRDFTPVDVQQTLANPEATELEKFLVSARDPETINERMHSEECLGLHAQALGALETSEVTTPFKELIAGHVVRAYILETRIDGSVSPQELEIVDDDGIYDTDRAKDIEARAMRNFLMWVIDDHVLTADDPASPSGRRSIITKPDSYNMLIDNLDDWSLEFILAYGEDAFAGTDPEMFFDAAQRVDVMPQTAEWSTILNRLKELRED